MAAIGGVLSGVNPFTYNESSPLTLFLFQTCLILATCNLVNIPFSKIRQPKVISEVIAGVILGPTVFGQIPNYTQTVFPQSSIAGLNLVANLGIILFMFFLGLEVDTEFIKKHLKTALSIGIITLAVPFGFGCILAIPLFHVYANQADSPRIIKFTVFMVFIAVSLAVTAFPVLCRILNELRLIKDRAGTIVLGAGIINDILGWVLLALSVILSNSDSDPINTVYILLCTFGWFLVYFYPLKYGLKWALIKTHELDRTKPSTFATMSVLFIMFISAYFTDIIGVHAIFGAFIAGLVVPRENNYVVKLTERMEDIPNIVFIPIYFAVAGLNVDLTLLNERRDWGYVFATIGIAISTKVVSGAIMGKIHGLFWREATAVGVLMSCKGIVEIVVLTVGLNAGIISKKIFAIFILMALVSTFVTTPLTLLVYPDSYRQEINQYLQDKEDNKDNKEPDSLEMTTVEEETISLNSLDDIKHFHFSEIINVINTLESIPTSLEILNYLLSGKLPSKTRNKTPTPGKLRPASVISNSSTIKSNHRMKKMVKLWSKNIDETETSLPVIGEEEEPCAIETQTPLKTVHLRLLTERTTDLLQSSAIYNEPTHFTANTDSVLQIFDIFSRLSNIQFSSEVVFSTMREKAVNILSMSKRNSDLILLPLKGASYQDSLLQVEEKYNNFEHFYSHLLGLNELSYNFFKIIAGHLSAHSAILISNSGGRLNVDRYKKKAINLLLPDPNLASSDLLAVYMLLLICHTEKQNSFTGASTIFVNSKNVGFAETLTNTFNENELFHESDLVVIPIDTEQKSHNEAKERSFIEAVLSDGLTDAALSDLEETTFIIPENFFFQDTPFSSETKETILESANKRFNVLIVHHCNNEILTKSPTISII
ncbi:Kha1p NDAI_0G05480 [Naumovozyma dairenensis CBS 421]|uniref:Cation/H+ exchanger transmembrane domain-containing protein n=1 Tax=Naumovozyma dairenensis (strain ATCC 10597 / BCRC 20456 / CBS 421 / NBRC 0211 / NRRL Y-12639) TaxID=1071378 RepID=J7S4M2_NAUDC|nr:hypothetical protein NDAI_0G05480 [Naumovozyma dairenensis CBS 421]CCK73531.1 hypothetical protein NDAI_0G05480 [Naumovozyma dairenensis CBS 421]